MGALFVAYVWEQIGMTTTTVKVADAKFLRRVFLALVFFATMSGVMAGVTVVRAMDQGTCVSCGAE